MERGTAQIRVPVDEDGFEAFVEERIRGPLADLARRTDRSSDEFIREASQHREDILGDVASERAAVESLRRQLRAHRRGQVSRLSLSIAGLLSVVGTLFDYLLNPRPEILWGIIALMGVGLLIALLGGSLDLVSRDDQAAPPSEEASQSSLPLRAQLGDAEANYRRALQLAIQRWLTERVNQTLNSLESVSLPALDVDGLAEVDDPKYEIATKARTDLESTIEHMPAGSVGISGPRGVGKTTLLQRLTKLAWRDDPKKIRAAILVDAPVQYEARDFVLHLFASLCEAVLPPERIASLRHWDQRFAATATHPWRRQPLAPYPPYLGPLIFALGAVAYLTLLDAQGRLDPHDWEPWSIALMLVGGALIYLTFIANLRRLGPWVRSLRPSPDKVNAQAERLLRQIWFQRTFTSGWSGSLKVPLGAAVGTERGLQLAENQLSFPEIVKLYRAFAGDLVRDGGEIRVGIDELDKMEDELARRFLNEIKVIFRAPGCFYFVSVSDDAMAYFERRGIPVREVFDSSFDAVERMGCLSYDDSRQLMQRRVVGLPIPFIALAHVLGGGLARDVIRASRDICGQPPETALDSAAENLCGEQLRAKCAAVRVAVRRLEDPQQVMLLSQWLTAIEESSSALANLFEHCRNFSNEFLETLGPPPAEGEVLKQYREALSIGLEIITFVYFTSTLLELTNEATPETFKRAIVEGSIDGMAQARQAFAINPAEAWSAVSAVRRSCGVEALDFPIRPESRRSKRGFGLLERLRDREPDRGSNGAVPGLAAGDRLH